MAEFCKKNFKILVVKSNESFEEYTLEQLEAYYAINPRKRPDVVYTPDATIAAEFCELFGYKIANEDYGLILLPL